MTFGSPSRPPPFPEGDDPKDDPPRTVTEGGRDRGQRGERHLSVYHFHRRLSLAVSCLSLRSARDSSPGFSLRSRGKSSPVGITVALVLVYYLFIAAARRWRDAPVPG